MDKPQPLDPLAVPLTGRHLIEASAGTGKTYTLTALYLRFILGHDPANPSREPLLPPDILVVTFTIAATKELSDRIRGRLTEAAACFAGYATPNPQDAVLNGLLDAYPAGKTREQYAAHLQAAADWMDEAAIYTIHGFCHRMLTQHAFSSGSPFDLTLSPDEALIRDEATADYWREHFYPLSEPALETAGAAVSRKPQAPKLSLDVFRQSLKALMIGDDDIPPAPNEPPTNTLVKQSAQWHAAIQGMRDALEQLDEFNVALEKAWEDGVLKKNSPNQKTWRDKTLSALKAWQAQPDVLLPPEKEPDFSKLTRDTFNNGLRVNQTLPSSIAEHPLPAAVDQFIEVCEALKATSDSLYAHAIQWIDTRIQQTKEQRGLIGYNDMLTRLLDALEKPTAGTYLAQTIREQFPVALIDEFQDTDPEQYGIFRAIYPQTDSPSHSLFLIGDPKQAIYSFRGADLETYLTAADEVSEKCRHTLNRNYRSSAAMVSATNTLFNQSPSAPNQFLQPMIRFYEVEHAEQKTQFEVNDQPHPAMTIWQHLPALNQKDFKSLMAAHCAEQIDYLLNAGASGQAGFMKQGAFKPLQAADIAILVRNHIDADIVRQALLRRGHRSVFLSDRDNVLKTPQAHDVLSWLNAMAQPGSERRVRTAIGTASLNYRWAELHDMFTNDARWETLLEAFWGYSRLWQQRGVLPALRRLIYDHQVAQRLGSQPDGERQLSNILQISEVLQEAAVTLDGPAALIRWLNEQMSQSDQATPADEQILRLESDANLIQVVTIHKSKGLEYPLVFLPLIGGDKQSANDAEQAEALRLLYVATTRAVHACWLGLATVKSLQKTAIGHILGCQSEPDSENLRALLDALAAKDSNIQLKSVPDATPTPTAYAGITTPEETPNRAIAREFKSSPPQAERWWIASYSALIEDGPRAWTPGSAEEDRFIEETQNTAPTTKSDRPKEGIHSLPSGPATGTFMHQLLQGLAEANFPTPEQTDFQRTLRPNLRSRRWQEHDPLITEWLAQLTTTPLSIGTDTPCRLVDFNSGEFIAEFEFLISVAAVRASQIDQLIRQHTVGGVSRPALGEATLHGMLKGYIDLIFVHNDQYFVLDYKSNVLGSSDQDYDPTSLKDAVLRKRYDAQYSLYLLALHRLLRARLGTEYDYNKHIGGAVCLFLRGINHPDHGVFKDQPDRALIEGLDQLLTGEITDVA